ncbi:MAG: hypothetical protein QW067_10380 [Thermofilaceae archaeon]
MTNKSIVYEKLLKPVRLKAQAQIIPIKTDLNWQRKLIEENQFLSALEKLQIPFDVKLIAKRGKNPGLYHLYLTAHIKAQWHILNKRHSRKVLIEKDKKGIILKCPPFNTQDFEVKAEKNLLKITVK